MNNHTKSGLNPNTFQSTVNGHKTKLITLENKNGMEICITNYGARVVSILAPDKNNVFKDVSLGFSSLEEYQSELDQFFGATVGRYANRIGGGSFALSGETYKLDQNDGKNCLHSGAAGWHDVVWDVDSVSSDSVAMSYCSPNGEGGFPGEVKATVYFKLTTEKTLRIEFSATTDQETVVNLTNHTYFNLKGECEGDVLGHQVTINAKSVTAMDGGLIPTGQILPVENTPLDFITAHLIGDRINAEHELIKLGSGYDHNYVLNKDEVAEGELSFAARVVEPGSGRVLEVWTTQPGLQFYSGNWLDEKVIGKGGSKCVRRGAFYLETQHFPDSPNHPSFPLNRNGQCMNWQIPSSSNMTEQKPNIGKR